MDTIQRQIISELRRKTTKQSVRLPYLVSRLKVNESRIKLALDELEIQQLVILKYSLSGRRISEISLNEEGEKAFVERALNNNKSSLQTQINELRELIEVLAKEAEQLESKPDTSPQNLDKVNKLVSAVNGATTLVRNAAEFYKLL